MCLLCRGRMRSEERRLRIRIRSCQSIHPPSHGAINPCRPGLPGRGRRVAVYNLPIWWRACALRVAWALEPATNNNKAADAGDGARKGGSKWGVAEQRRGLATRTREGAPDRLPVEGVHVRSVRVRAVWRPRKEARDTPRVTNSGAMMTPRSMPCPS